MSSQLLTALSGIFGLYCIGREVIKIIRSKQIKISNLILIVYGVTYGIMLSLLLLFNDLGIYRTQGEFLRVDYSPEGLNYLAWWFFAAVIGYASFRFAGMFRINGSSREQGQELLQPDNKPALLNSLQIASIICLAIGIVCFWIWTSGWGGYVNMFVVFPVKEGSKTTHLVNLIHEGMMTDKGSNEEKKGTYRFTLCHNSYGDKLTPPQTQGYLLTGGYVSFPLSSFISENEAEIQIDWVWYKTIGTGLSTELDNKTVSTIFKKNEYTDAPSTSYARIGGIR